MCLLWHNSKTVVILLNVFKAEAVIVDNAVHWKIHKMSFLCLQLHLSVFYEPFLVPLNSNVSQMALTEGSVGTMKSLPLHRSSAQEHVHFFQYDLSNYTTATKM